MRALSVQPYLPAGCFDFGKRSLHSCCIHRKWVARVAYPPTASLVLMVLVCVYAQAQSTRTAHDYFKRGAARHVQQDFDGAISDFTRVIDIISRPGKNYHPPGNNSKDDAGAVAAADLGQVRVVDQRAAPAYAHRGLARLAKGDVEEAIIDFD